MSGIIIGTYSGAGASASANEWSTIDDLLVKLPDNTANLINAKDLRDSVYTLWEKIDDVQTLASQSASASIYYSNTNPVPISIGGIQSGATFSNKTMEEMWNSLLYPYISPSSYLSISGSGATREFGSSNAVSLLWGVVRNTNIITSVIVGGTPISSITGNTENGIFNTNISQNVNTILYNIVSDGIMTFTSSTSVTWLNAIYWGKKSTFDFSPSDMVITSPPTHPYWADGAGVSRGGVYGKYLTTTKSGSYNGINGSGQYLVFAWPTSFGNPIFTINGLQNTAFTKMASSISCQNMYGYTNTYDVWMSNTIQNSPIASFVIS